jgi:flavin reductase (DIM6/NTAB) family NADH-FMN oxidoreductase RutF
LIQTILKLLNSDISCISKLDVNLVLNQGGIMVKKEIEGNILNPLPIALVGTLVGGRPNYCVIGYLAPFNFGKHVFFSLYKKRFTWSGIEKNRTFSVNIPSEEQMKEVVICGSKSGREVDKSQLFHTFYGELKNTPMIKECPLTMECKVADILDYDLSKGIIGEVVKSYADPGIFVEGVVDLQKAHLITWTAGDDFAYYHLGEKIVLPRDQIE